MLAHAGAHRFAVKAHVRPDHYRRSGNSFQLQSTHTKEGAGQFYHTTPMDHSPPLPIASAGGSRSSGTAT